MTTVYVIRDIEGGIRDAFDDPAKADSLVGELNKPLYEEEISSLQEALTRIETYMAEQPLTEFDMALFDADHIGHAARERGVRRAARQVVEMLLDDLPHDDPRRHSINDPRIVREEIVGRLKELQTAGFEHWMYHHGSYWVETITTSEKED